MFISSSEDAKIRQATAAAKNKGYAASIPGTAYALLGQTRVKSRVHSDPEGAGTVIRVLRGQKNWYVLVNSHLGDKNCSLYDDLELYVDNMQNWSEKYWDMGELSVGDTL
jgi:hypothetical protein